MPLDAPDVVLLVFAAFAAGLVNAIAGGGTLISFPALIAAGYPSKVANVTNTVAVLPGYLGGSLAYRDELKRQPKNIATILAPTLLGALAGSVLLLGTPEETFETIVPFLVLGACALLAFQDRLSKIFRPNQDDKSVNMPLLQAGVFGSSIYGAYFGAGLGIVVLATLGLFMPDDIQRSNALKGIIALLVNGLAAVYFMIFADVAFEAASVMAIASLAGGYSGGRVARKLPRARLRAVVIVYGVIAAIVLLIRT